MMIMKSKFFYWTAWLLVLLVAAPPWVMAQGSTQETQESKVFKQEELDQMLAPIALYPDDLLTQLLMASTYPLEIVQAARWTKQNKNLKGDALTEALEKQDWDPSVKSLVNFPEVLEKMNEDLEWTNKLGDAFLAQQKEVMDTIQNLRRKAEQAGNLKDTPQQKVIVEKETQTIVIQPANPETIYVPSYNPAVVYGSWWWPAFPPPLPFFPFVPGAMMYGAMSFGMRFAAGAAWGYAWGHANWGGGNVNVNVNRNANFNNNINRNNYANRTPGGGQGNWQHDASHRKGASYRDQGTAQKFGRGSSSDAARSREAFRGRSEQGRQDLARGGGDRGSFGGRGGQPTASQQGRGTGGAGQRASQQRAGGGGGQSSASQRGGRESAFGGSQRGGSEARQQSSRGSSSRQSMSSGGGRSSGGGSRGGGGGGGRSGGGGGGGGGRR